MLDLAQNHTGEFIPLRDVAERQGITVKYLEQIISALGKARLLKSSRGNVGIRGCLQTLGLQTASY
jgi:DNA-binding IscR family transcriptional regulator